MSQLLMAVDVVYAFSLPNLDHGFCFSEYTRVPYTRVPAAPPAPATAPRGINLATGVAAAAAVGAKAAKAKAVAKPPLPTHAPLSPARWPSDPHAAATMPRVAARPVQRPPAATLCAARL